MMRISAHEVLGFVAMRHGLGLSVMLSERRTQDIARPRQIAMYVIRQICPHMSYPAIARLLKRADHTTIIHGVRNIDRLLRSDPWVIREVAATLAHFRDGEDVQGAEIARVVSHLGALILDHRAMQPEVRL